MIDVLKRLAALDADNPNVVKEGQQSVEECGMGMMPEMHPPMDRPSTPATINMTAGSGEELGNLLKDIMSLAGMNNKSDPIGMAPMVPPAAALEPVGGDQGGEKDMSPTDTMRSVIDKLNPETDDDKEDDEEEETDETVDSAPNPQTTGYSNMTPSGDDMHKEKSQHPGAAAKGDNPLAMEQKLMADWKEFMAESKECPDCHKPMKKCKCD